MPQQLVLTPLGIITEPNELGQIPAGAFSSASGIVMRQPGKIHGVVNWSTRYTLTGTDAGTTCAFVVATTSNFALILFNRTAGWAYVWVDLQTNTAAYGPTALTAPASGSPTAEPQSFTITRQPGFCGVLFGGQTFVNAYSNVLAWDTEAPTTAALAAPRMAGLRAPALYYNFSPAGFAIKAYHYAIGVAIVRRKILGREYVSPISAACRLPAFDTDCNVNVIVFLRQNFHVVGDIVEIYRTRQFEWVFASPSVLENQSENAGSEYQLCASHVITAADVAAGDFSVLLDGTDEGLGQACYTNQAIAGVGAQAFAPPALRVFTAYKGHLIGLGPTEPPAFTFRAKGYWGYSNNNDPQEFRNSSYGSVYVGLTYTIGANTATAASAALLGPFRVGSYINSSGLSGTAQVTSIVGTTVTFSGAVGTVNGLRDSTVTDRVVIDGVSDLAYDGMWVADRILPYSEFVMPSLKLAAYTNTVPNLVPVEPVIVKHAYLRDSRPSLQIGATRPENLIPEMASWVQYQGGSPTTATALERPAAVVWSENNQPESWPGVNVEHFSSGTPHAVCTTRDAVIAFYSDGIWRFSGTGGSAGAGYDWRADQIASGVTISGSQCACVLNDVVYAYTSEGFVGIDSAGTISRISHGRIGDQLSGPPWNDGAYNNTTAMFVCADEEHGEILIRSPETFGGAMWRYNTITDTFVQTTSHDQPTHAAYSRYMRNVLVVGKTGASTWSLRAEASVITATGQVQFQPIYTDNPFSLKHWQQFDVGVEASSAVITASFNGVTDVSRTATDAGLSENARVGFAIPRNAPAIANTICPGLTINPDAGDFSLQGFALQFEDLTEQRNKR